MSLFEKICRNDRDLKPETAARDLCLKLYFKNAWARIHFVFLLIALAVWAALVVKYISDASYITNLGLACIGFELDARQIGDILMSIGYCVVMACIFIGFIMQLCCNCGERMTNVCLFIPFITFCVFILYFGLLSPLFLSFNFMGMDPNNKFYQCNFGGSRSKSAFPVFFSDNQTNFPVFNQTCSFESISYLCGSSARDSKMPPLVNVNGTLGAFLCKPSSLEGWNLCSNVSTGLASNAAVISILSLVFLLFMVVSLFWIGCKGDVEEYRGCYRECRSKPCFRCSPCCGEYESLDNAAL